MSESEAAFSQEKQEQLLQHMRTHCLEYDFNVMQLCTFHDVRTRESGFPSSEAYILYHNEPSVRETLRKIAMSKVGSEALLKSITASLGPYGSPMKFLDGQVYFRLGAAIATLVSPEETEIKVARNAILLCGKLCEENRGGADRAPTTSTAVFSFDTMRDAHQAYDAFVDVKKVTGSQHVMGNATVLKLMLQAVLPSEAYSRIQNLLIRGIQIHKY